MSEILELDSHINSECLEADKSPSYDKYTEDIMSFCEEERLAQQAPNVPVLNPIDQESEIKKEMPETVTNMIQAHYSRHGVEDSLTLPFTEFANQMLKTPMFELTGSLTYKSLSIEDAG